jgi:biotin transporter BioY
MHVAGARNVENFSAFFTQLFSYITFAMVVGYCFNHALRNREKFWNAVFVMNCIGLLVVFVLILAVRFATSYQNGAGGVMLVFVPLGMIFAVNVAMLLASAKKNMNEETELQNDA